MPFPTTTIDAGGHILFFPFGPAEFAAFGHEALLQLRARNPGCALIADEACRPLARLLGANESAGCFFVPRACFDEPEAFNRMILRLTRPGQTFCNPSLNPFVCALLGAVTGENNPARGIVFRADRFEADTPEGLAEIDFRATGRRPGTNRRARLLRALGLEPTPVPPPLPLPPPPPGGKNPRAVLLACSAPARAASYPFGEELAECLRREGFEVVSPSPAAAAGDDPEALLQALGRAALVVAADNLAAALALRAGLPAIGLAGSTDPEDAGFTHWARCAQPCQPCLEAECQYRRPRGSCLEELRPETLAAWIAENAARVCKPGAAPQRLETGRPVFRPAPPQPGPRRAHVACFHGLGDAVRFAWPLSVSLAHTGVETHLYVTPELAGCLTQPPPGVFVQPKPPPWLVNPRYATAGDEALILGSSAADLAVQRTAREQNIRWWGFSAEKVLHRYTGPGSAWTNLPDFDKSPPLLCALLGTAPAPAELFRLSPDPAQRDHPFRAHARPLVGVHGRGGWPAKSYPHTRQLQTLLERDFDVWRFDEDPCPSLARLAWIIRDSAAVLTVDTLVLHLAVALGTPALLIQGPVWHAEQAAPWVVRATRTTARPTPILRIDRAARPLAAVPPELLADEFSRFVRAADRAPWRNTLQ